MLVLIWGILCFVVVTLPGWVSDIWGLVKSEPLIPYLAKNFAIQVPSFSPYWITTPIGGAMLAFIIYLLLTDRSDALGELSKLGWIVKPGANAILFEVSGSQSLPPAKESATYLNQVNRPFSLRFHLVHDIQGLHEFGGARNCTKIDIAAGYFSDISELRGFTGLTSLHVSQTPFDGLSVVDLSPVSTLVNLREIGLAHTKVKNINALAALTELEQVNLMETLVRDLSPISGLKRLQVLDIRGTTISDLSAISETQTLKELTIGGAQLAGLAKLSALENLKTLNIIEQGDIDLTSVGSLSNLESLWIWGPTTDRRLDVSPLRNLTNLRKLKISSIGLLGATEVVGIDALGELHQLTHLSLASLRLGTLAFLGNLKGLTEIHFGEIPIFSIESFRNLKALTSVSLSQTSVVDIEPLLDLPELANLNVLRTPARADLLTVLEKRGVTVRR